MLRQYLVSTAFLFAWILPTSAHAAAGDCPDRKLPYALNIGVSRLSDSPALHPADLERDIKALFGDFYAEHGLCPSRQLQINIMVASDYEILDWLGHDLLDAAVVPDLTVYLLQRDHFPLREMEVKDHPVGDLLLPAVRMNPLSGRRVGQSWQEGNPQADFAAFLDQSWRLALHPGAAGAEDGPAPAYRIVLSSHLSTPGFLDPVTKAAEWMQKHMPPAWRAERKKSFQDRFWQVFFDNARFAVDCDSLEHGNAPQSCWRLPANEKVLGSPTEILFPGESVLRRLRAKGETAGSGFCRERLVLSGRAADELFASGLSDAKAQLPDAVKSLFENPPAAWAPILDAEPSFGVRTFGFTVDESLRLLHQNQSTSGRTDLALVLPGGGVKAAYQSGIVDELYRLGSLKNSVEGQKETSAGGPLPVKYVIGTSGGALLGFFVSQLGEKGPWGLSRILPRPWLNAAGETPFFLTGLLLVLVCVGANYFLGHAPGGRDLRWRLFYAGTLVVAALLLLILCWQPQGGEDSHLREAFGTQTLEITFGTFLLCIGLIVLMLGGIAWAYASHRRFHLRLRELLIGFFVALLHAVAVYLVLYAVMKMLPDWLSPLELTGAFWLWLLAASLILGTVLLLAGLGRLGRKDSKAVDYLRTSLVFLCSHHPNGNVVTRRFLRLAVLGVLALSWWNLVLAPALYGNRSAREYLGGAVHRFEQQTGASKDDHRFRPTARFVVPANLLARDGTRYFLFVPQGDACPPIPQRSGAQWLRYEADAGKVGGLGGLPAVARRGPRCASIPDKKFLEDVIFASGSPFPIFPAHRLELKPGAGKEPLVDGGYSNNIPVDVALSVEAEQVLIVDSSSPLDSPSPSTWLSRLGDGLTGDLVKNLSRLPGSPSAVRRVDSRGGMVRKGYPR